MPGTVTGLITGSGTVRYRVDENTGPQRVGSIIAAGLGFVITQSAPLAPADFIISNAQPEIGEVVAFTVDPTLEVASWDFGEADCDGTNPVINCTFLPASTCNTNQWTYPTSGQKSITMVLTDARTKTKTLTVAPSGSCWFFIFADGFESGDRSAWSSTGPPPCAHEPCETGTALDPQCDPCVTQICAVDDYCCTGLWDRACVDRVASVCGEICHSCAHDLCETGLALNPQCHSCVDQICTLDDYCCTELWDRTCVDQVPSVCGLTCD